MGNTGKITIVIPARNEFYLDRTVDDIFTKARGDIEVVVILDGCQQDPPLKKRPNLTVIQWNERQGMRAAINTGTEAASGEYLMKLDGHCLLCEGFDEILKADCDSDWIVIPRRYSLEPDTWTIRHEGHKEIDYEYLDYPTNQPTKGGKWGLQAKYWWYQRQAERASILVDENMTFQGSCWFMPTTYFRKLIYPLNPEGYGTFLGEAQEIGLKIWLSGGKNIVNKKVWYAHLWKGQPWRDLHFQKTGEHYSRVGKEEFNKGQHYIVDYWMNDTPFSGKIHDLSWLVERFWPVPTWPEDRKLWTNLTK